MMYTVLPVAAPYGTYVLYIPYVPAYPWVVYPCDGAPIAASRYQPPPIAPQPPVYRPAGYARQVRRA